MNFDLNGELTRYLNRVIGLKLPIFNNAQPSIEFSVRNKGQIEKLINLPTSHDTLGQFLTQQWVRGANKNSIRTFLLSALYHEAAHDMSGEPGKITSTEDRKVIETHSLEDWVANKMTVPVDHWEMPDIILNVVNDVNDYTFSLLTWPGKSAIMGSIGRVMFWMGDPVEPMTIAQVKALPPDDRKTEEFSRLQRCTLWYMRNLKVRYDNKVLRSIPLSDPLSLPFNDIKDVVKKMRREKDATKRVPFVFEMYDAWLAHWKWCGGTEQEFRDFLHATRQQLAIPSNIFGQGQSGAGQMQSSLDSVADDGSDELDQAKPGSSKGNTKRGKKGKGKSAKREPSSLSPHIDQGNLRRLSRSIETRICERIRQTGVDDADVQGVVLAPIHFPDVFTRPKTPRLWKGGEGVSTTISGHIVGVWDRSGSMDERGGVLTKCDITKETVCTMHAGLYTHNRLRMDNVAYDHEANLITFPKGSNLEAQLKIIGSELSARGGTDAANGVHLANQKFKEVHAQRRLMILMTDGDLHGYGFSIETELAEAKKMNVDVCVIGLGTSVNHIQGIIHEENIFVIEDAMELPDVVDSLVLSRT
jgi:hypothetical protein